MAELADAHRLSPVETALRYPLSFPAVATVIPGMLQEKEVRENARFSKRGPLTEDVVSAIRNIYETNNRFLPE